MDSRNFLLNFPLNFVLPQFIYSVLNPYTLVSTRVEERYLVVPHRRVNNRRGTQWDYRDGGNVYNSQSVVTD